MSSALKIAVDITLARTIEEWEKYSEYLVEFLQVVWVAVAVIMSLEILQQYQGMYNSLACFCHAIIHSKVFLF